MMQFLLTDNIREFEEGFISYYKRDILHNNVTFPKGDFSKSLRVFSWFVPGEDFSDIREVSEKIIQFLNNEDPVKLGLLHFLTAYVNKGDLDCTNFTGGISNNIPQTIRALANTYKNLLQEDNPNIDVSLFKELELKFKHLENVRKFVLMYLSNFGQKHLEELSVMVSYHPVEIEDILYHLVIHADERTKAEKQDIYFFILKIVEHAALDLTTNTNWEKDSIHAFITEFEASASSR
jgi:hypothetical protein